MDHSTTCRNSRSWNRIDIVHLPYVLHIRIYYFDFIIVNVLESPHIQRNYAGIRVTWTSQRDGHLDTAVGTEVARRA